MVKKIVFTLFTFLVISTSYFYYLFYLKDYENTDGKLSDVLNEGYTVTLPVSDMFEPLPDERPEDGQPPSTDQITVSELEEKEPAYTTDSEGEISSTMETDETNPNTELNQLPSKETGSESTIAKKDIERNETLESEAEPYTNQSPSTNTNATNKTDEQQIKKDKTNSTEKGQDVNQIQNTNITVELIKEKYVVSFDELKEQANKKIDQVVERAMEEYDETLERGEEISYTYFLTKYGSIATKIEKQTDETFQSIYNSLQNELQKHGFNPDEAIEFKIAYEAAKEEYQALLIQKAMEKMNT